MEGGASTATTPSSVTKNIVLKTPSVTQNRPSWISSTRYPFEGIAGPSQLRVFDFFLSFDFLVHRQM